MVYFNNIIIYFNNKEEYRKYIKWVLKRLYKENILIIIKKYKFYIKKTNFIGFIIKLGQISIDLSSTKEKKKGAYRNYSKLGYYARECRSRPREQRPN